MSTRELTWTDEMFRIYETTPAEFVVSWDSMLAQCTPESLKRYSAAAGARRIGATGTSISSSKSPRSRISGSGCG